MVGGTVPYRRHADSLEGLPNPLIECASLDPVVRRAEGDVLAVDGKVITFRDAPALEALSGGGLREQE